MSKTTVTIEQELLKHKSGNLIQITIKANYLNKEITLYEDKILTLDFVSSDSLINKFIQWTLNEYDNIIFAKK